MTELEALEHITRVIHEISKRNMEITMESNIYDDELLDSLDTMLFFMELEKQFGLSIPESEDLMGDGWYNINKLCTELATINTKK